MRCSQTSMGLLAFGLLLVVFVAPVRSEPVTSMQSMCGLQEEVAPLTVVNYLPAMATEHELVQAARDRKEAASSQVRQAEAAYYPSVDATADAGPEYTRRPKQSDTDFYYTNTQSLTVTQLVYDFGQTESVVDRAEAALVQAEINVQLVQQDVLFEGISAYLGIVRGFERLGYARQSEQSIKKQTGIEESLVEVGAGVSTDVLQAKSQLAGATATRVLAGGELSNARSSFKQVFEEMPTEWEVARFRKPSLPMQAIPADLETAIEIAMEQNPQILLATQNVMIAQSDVKLADSGFYPILQLVGSASRRENDVAVAGVRHELAGLFRVTYNLYRGGADTAAYEAATDNLAAARKQLADLRDRTEEQVRTAWQNLETQRENARYLEIQSDILWEFLTLARKERRLGNRSLLDVLVGEVNYINARSSAVTAETDTLLAAYQLLFAMGRLTHEVFAR